MKTLIAFLLVFSALAHATGEDSLQLDWTPLCGSYDKALFLEHRCFSPGVSGCTPGWSLQQLDYATLKLKPLPIKPSELENAASRILNDLAVLRLRAGDPLGAARLLEQISTTHPHGQYNLACAYARLGLADSGVQSLRRAPAAPGLANKISRDADFNLIRKSPELISFLTTLSTDAGL